MPRGGRRVGAGRKPKSAAEIELDGNAGHRAARVLPHPSVPGQSPEPVVFDEFDAPNDLTLPERQVWLELAPHAFAAGTLTKGTSLAFRILCGNVLLEREMRASVLDRGRAAHQGLITKVESGLLRFNLNPCGKAMQVGQAEPKKPVNPLEKYLHA